MKRAVTIGGVCMALLLCIPFGLRLGVQLLYGELLSATPADQPKQAVTLRGKFPFDATPAGANIDFAVNFRSTASWAETWCGGGVFQMPCRRHFLIPVTRTGPHSYEVTLYKDYIEPGWIGWKFSGFGIKPYVNGAPPGRVATPLGRALSHQICEVRKYPGSAKRLAYEGIHCIPHKQRVQEVPVRASVDQILNFTLVPSLKAAYDKQQGNHRERSAADTK